MSNYLIIGGSSGIGQQIVNDLAAQNHNVIATFCNHESTSLSSNISYQKLDVLENNIQINHLPDMLDGIVYCPGSIQLKPFQRITPEEFIADYQLQVIGAIKVMQHVLPNLKNASSASIVLFSTVAVQLGLNFHSQVAASKGAIEGLTKALSAEFAPKIRVNCIAPSLTNTPLANSLLNSEQKMEANNSRHPLKRIGTSEDIANMACFLLSEKSSWITGQIFHVDGGMSTIK